MLEHACFHDDRYAPQLNWYHWWGNDLARETRSEVTAHDGFLQVRIDDVCYLYYYCVRLDWNRNTQRYWVTWVLVWHLIQYCEKNNFHSILHEGTGLMMKVSANRVGHYFHP